MKLAAIFPVYNQFALARLSISMASENKGGDTEIIALDNDSTEPLTGLDSVARTVRLAKNIGVYPTFWEGLKHTDAEIVAFFHSDLIITEKNWDKRIIAAFEEEPELGLIGFIGSNEIDASGGRGLGTCSNFQGDLYHQDEMYGWKGSPALVHGRCVTGVEYAAVIDGCAMVFRRSALERIPERQGFPPHHFYDRLLSSEVRELGYKIMVMGIACDHISGQTVNQEPGYAVMAEEWATAHGHTMEGVHNWDTVLYKEAERQWLSEYRDEKQLVPCKV